MDLNETKMGGKILVDQPRRGRASFLSFYNLQTHGMRMVMQSNAARIWEKHGASTGGRKKPFASA